MTKASNSQVDMQQSVNQKVQLTLKKRYAREKRLKVYGMLAVFFGMLFVAFLFINIISKGYSAFLQTQIRLDIDFSESIIDPQGQRSPEVLSAANYAKLIKQSLLKQFPSVRKRRDKKMLYSIVSSAGQYQLREMVLENPELIGQSQAIWLIADDEIDMLNKGAVDRQADDSERRVKQKTIDWIDHLQAAGNIRKVFNTDFFTHGDSREPEQAGIGGAAIGSLLTLSVTLLLSFPIGVAAALYLEEFAPKNNWTQLIEVNINNLAAVPSIVFGLLGLAVYINFFELPRSAPLVGGLVLTLMTLPTIIIASRSALKSVPPSIREAALGIGASRMQTVFHHVLPLAMPGMLTGTIIGMARALGETAPLLMIGMIAFIVDVPGSVFDPSTVLPVQIFLWADSPEQAFRERTSAAIMVLLAFLLAMNLIAVFLRRHFERKW